MRWTSSAGRLSSCRTASTRGCPPEARLALSLKVMGSDPRFAEFRDLLSSPDLNIFYDAPVLIVICAKEDDRFVEQDCCLAAQNLMLAAYEKGLGTCWIGFAEAWLNRPEAKKELSIPPTFRPIAPVILGYPQGQPKAPPRHAPEHDLDRALKAGIHARHVDFVTPVLRPVISLFCVIEACRTPVYAAISFGSGRARHARRSEQE